jgi:DNA-binding MarR family transcriptional regulator
MALVSEHDLTTPALLRAARGAYAQSMRAALADVGVEDLPRNGAFILAGIDSSGGPRTDIPRELGVTKQAVSNAIEALVVKGYVERGADPGDRRRIALELTNRGQTAVDAVQRGIGAVDDELNGRVGPEQVESLRAGLWALAQIKDAHKEGGTGRTRPTRQLRRCFPMFSVRDMTAATAHYRALGFTVVPDAEGDAHAFARREGAGLHLVVDDHADGGGVAYLHVRDADALYAEWQAADAGGELHPVETTSYGMREGTHVDHDGNAIHFGSDAGD